MALVKNEIPILEYDDNPRSVIMPNHEKLGLTLPQKAVFPFLYDFVKQYAKAHPCEVAGEFVSATKNYPIYVTTFGGQQVALCQAPVGAAPAAQILDWLIGYGVTEIISAGSCGALTSLPENAFLIPTKALRDEGTSYHYLPPARFVETSPQAVAAIEQALEIHNYPYAKCVTWSTDGFYRETREKVEYRRQEGCAVVEMECAALAACAKFRGAKFGHILFTADTLADSDHYDTRDWGKNSLEIALELCLEAVVKI